MPIIPAKILVVAAHPDDEILGCGATVALRVEQGAEAHVVYVATGVTARYAPGDADSPSVQEELARLKIESARAAQVIGFSSQRFLDFPDQRLDTVSRTDIARALDAILDELRPDVVYTHHSGDYNWDHTAVFDAVLMAARSSAGEFAPREIYSFEVASSTERAAPRAESAFLPNVYVHVARTIDKKKLAMRYYENEARPYPHPRSVEGIEYTARRRGLEVGLDYAEAFCLVRRVES